MEEEYTPLETQLFQAINDSLHNHIASNASFLAERLLAEKDTEQTRHLLAECYLAENKPYKSFYILKDCKSEQNRYLFALTCLKMNKLREAEQALLQNNSNISDLRKSTSINLQNGHTKNSNSVPNGSYGLYMLGILYEKQQKFSDAKEYFLKALEMNPTLWAAYEKLCKMGEQILPNKVFNEPRYKTWEENSTINSSTADKKNLALNGGPKKTGNGSMLKKPDLAKFNEADFQQEYSTPSIENDLLMDGTSPKKDLLNQSSKSKEMSTLKTLNFLNGNFSSQNTLGSFNGGDYSTNSMINNYLAGNSNTSQKMLMMKNSGGPNLYQNAPPGVSQHMSNSVNKMVDFSNLTNIIISNDKNLKGSQFEQHQLELSRKLSQNSSQASSNYAVPSMKKTNNYRQSPHKQISIPDLMTLLRRLGEPFYHMSFYLCTEAIELFEKLPHNQYKTGWVLCNIGKCYMEIIKYSEAEKFYAEALNIEPYRLEGVHFYSSCLWHLKKQVDLCNLAYNALEKSAFAPETWITVGNCFSLQKEHENALKFFNRAIQLNSNNAYAYSLCGHEYVYNEDLQKAKRCFETALNLDLRHYNAWWGLGNIYYKQEKYDRAAEHFQRAISINSRCPVLYSYLGMTLTCKREFSEALKYFDNSELLDPSNVLNKFQKANVLVQLEQFDASLIELDKLRILMPKEAPIPILIGKIYKKLGKIDKAHYYFNLALDLEAKDTQRIKGYIESLHSSNEFNEDMEF